MGSNNYVQRMGYRRYSVICRLRFSLRLSRDEKEKRRKKEGKKEAEKCGEERVPELIKALLKDNLMEDVEKVLRNKSYRGKMYKKYGIS